MSSDDPTEYSDSSEESESPPSEPVPERPKATLSTYMTTFGHLVPLYRGAMDVWIFEEWSTLVATLFQGEGVPPKRLGADSGDVPPRGCLTLLDA